jgi:folate-binding protein YgfZ
MSPTETTRSVPELAADLDALRAGCAVAEPGLRTAVAVSGPDHRDWLDRLTSMPVKELPPGRAQWTTLMDGKGKLRADLRVLAPAADGVLLELPASHHAALLRVLDMYILREKVTLGDLSRSHRFVAVLGPQAGAALRAAGLPEPKDDEALAAPGVLAAARSRLFGAPGADLLVEAGAADELLARLQRGGARAVSVDALQIARLEQGVPWFAEDLADGVIPLEAGLDEHVSITKGCYPGQEVVARIKNLGQVARRLVRLSGAGEHALATGAALVGTGAREGQEAGKVSSSAVDPVARRTLALGYVRRAFWEPGMVLRAGDAELTVAALPAS